MEDVDVMWMQAERALIAFISTQQCLGKELDLQPPFHVFHLQVFLFPCLWFFLPPSLIPLSPIC